MEQQHENTGLYTSVCVRRNRDITKGFEAFHAQSRVVPNDEWSELSPTDGWAFLGQQAEMFGIKGEDIVVRYNSITSS